MYPEPLQEKGIYKHKDLTVLLLNGKIYELVTSNPPQWRLMGSKDNYSLLLEDLADVEYTVRHKQKRPKEMRRVNPL